MEEGKCIINMKKPLDGTGTSLYNPLTWNDSLIIHIF